MLLYGKYECLVMQILYVCVLCASCSRSQFCMTCSLLMLVEDARGIIGCVAMRSAVLFIFRSILLLYSAGSGVNRVQVVLSGFSVRLFCFVQVQHYVGMVVWTSWLHSCLCPICTCVCAAVCLDCSNKYTFY